MVCNGNGRRTALGRHETDAGAEQNVFSLQVLGPAVVHKPVNVEVTFTNPLADEVTDCVLRAEGSGLLKEQLRIQYVNTSGLFSLVGNLEDQGFF